MTRQRQQIVESSCQTTKQSSILLTACVFTVFPLLFLLAFSLIVASWQLPSHITLLPKHFDNLNLLLVGSDR